MREPGKKHMSKEERDLICEKLRDEAGAKAKRRREIEEMDEEDVQAEIRRTEAAMRGSQGLSMGKLPLAMMVLCLVGGASGWFHCI
jgi:hypothetical protein